MSYNLTSRSGSESGFKAMVERCKKANVKIYVDAVLNHCAAPSKHLLQGMIGYRQAVRQVYTRYIVYQTFSCLEGDIYLGHVCIHMGVK